jgi:hypothetical protein
MISAAEARRTRWSTFSHSEAKRMLEGRARMRERSWISCNTNEQPLYSWSGFEQETLKSYDERAGKIFWGRDIQQRLLLNRDPRSRSSKNTQP